MQLVGFPWFKQHGVYRRLPRPFREAFPAAVDELAGNSAGGQVRFRTDSKRLAVRARVSAPHDADHMAATGVCGFDCYMGQRFVGVTRFARAATEYESVVMTAVEAELRDITINFPLYRGVEEVHIGVEEGAQVLAPPPFADDRPIVVYGTSITQGGCASRPGMAYTNILSRWLQRPFVNLGFSGSGNGEPALAEAMAEIVDPAAYVLDYEANAGLEGIKDTLPRFLDILRAAHPSAPILVISRPHFARDRIDPGMVAQRDEARDFQRDTVAALNAAGDTHVHFHDGADLMGEDFDECYVDGVHPTDLGFYRMAKALRPVLEQVLGPVTPDR
jgi:lysophospholipase L1-like esterase